MRNWKTTLAGAVGAAALTSQSLFTTGDVDGKTLITAIVIAVVSFLSKDFNVSGKK